MTNFMSKENSCVLLDREITKNPYKRHALFFFPCPVSSFPSYISSCRWHAQRAHRQEMRLSFITLFLSCLSLTLSVYSKPHFLSRRDPNRPLPDVLSSRQYRFPRDILDVCINTDVDLLANAGQLLSLESILGALGISTKIHLCLCLKVDYMRRIPAYTKFFCIGSPNLSKNRQRYQSPYRFART